MIGGLLRGALASILFLKSLKMGHRFSSKDSTLHITCTTLIYLDKYKVYGSTFQIHI